MDTTELPDPLPAVRDAARLKELRRLRLLDTPAEEAFDRLTRLATTVLRVPVALVSLVDERRQFFKSCTGLAEPWATDRETPLTHSFCQYAVATDRPLLIEDAREHPTLATNGAVGDIGVVAYAGVPIRTRTGQPVGSLCAIDGQPRHWTAADLEVLRELAGLAGDLVELRAGDLDAADRELLVRQLVAAQEAERARIASEVHDDSLQVITAVSIRLQLLRQKVDPSLAPTVETLLANVQDASDRLRNLLFDLRPSALDNADLAAAIRAYLDHVSRDALPIWTVTSSLVSEPAPEARLVLFRIAQEALSNALAHAAASAVSVSLDAGREGVVLQVVDDGAGFDPSPTSTPGHLGLITMRERAELAGGTLRVTSSPGAGTTVRAWVPVRLS